MKHPTKEGFISALRAVADRLEAELEIPDDPEELEYVAPDGVMAELAVWLSKELYDWGYYAGYEAAAGKPPVASPSSVKMPQEKAAAQTTMFGDETH